MKLQDLFDKYPRIHLAHPDNQTALFSVINQTSLETSSLQISFDRSPDFYKFLKAQGDKAFVFTFHNKDGSPHGFACLTFRRMLWQNHPINLGYASDLRTTKKLDREARLQWRKMYAEIIKHVHEIDEFKSIGIVTAVWNENKLAQAALVNQNRAKDFQYKYLLSYDSYSIWGRWKFWNTKASMLRAVKADEVLLIQKNLQENPDGLSWLQDDLNATLSAFNKTLHDFLVLEIGGQIKAFGIPLSQNHMKKVEIKAWPKTLAFAAKILPFFGKREVKLKTPLEMRQLCFFRSLQGDAADNLSLFINSLWNENSKQVKAKQFHILNYFAWKVSTDKKPSFLLKAGFLSTKIEGALYKVVCPDTLTEFDKISDMKELEGNFL